MEKPRMIIQPIKEYSRLAIAPPFFRAGRLVHPESNRCAFAIRAPSDRRNWTRFDAVGEWNRHPACPFDFVVSPAAHPAVRTIISRRLVTGRNPTVSASFSIRGFLRRMSSKPGA